ncbi:MAG: membrane protein insertion efficiency factor YidD [Henriciella sp.]|nr:membrane protein insertion efficiency factor YidD [Henriciella sp.]
MRRKFMYGLLRVYKLTLSPVFMLFGAQCRHEPTCSEYCAECISRFGFWRGSWMTLARLQRCRPGGSRGFDPVPHKLNSAPFWAPGRLGVWTKSPRSSSDN